MRKFAKVSDEEMKKTIQVATLMVHGTAVKSIQKSSPGESQIRYKPRRGVVAAKPGKAPNTDTGRLVQSIAFEFEDGGMKGLVGTNLRYGKHLEFGTNKMAARPWLKPAVRANRKKIEKLFEKTLADAVKRGT